MATANRTDKRKSDNGHTRAAIRAAAVSNVKHAAMGAKERFSEVEESVENYAKEHPWKTMGITLLAGVVVGQLLNLRNK